MATRAPGQALVLVVEDDAFLRMVVIALIKKAGFDVVEAANADEAIRILERRTDIRIVFTDIDMPGSMDGLKLAEAVRGRWPPIEIIVTSGHPRARNRALPARGVFLAKPYDCNEVVATLKLLAVRREPFSHAGGLL
jgi:CheY-like chemotaxis protein